MAVRGCIINVQFNVGVFEMINVTEIHMEPSNSSYLEHIANLRWAETSEAGERSTTYTDESTRAEMYIFVRDNPEKAYAISRNDDRYAFLEAVNGTVQYVKTIPDSTRSDNLLSLPRY
jgi:hypothetical protein